MKSGRWSEVLCPYDWLPRYGENAVSLFNWAARSGRSASRRMMPDVEGLLRQMNARGKRIDRATLERIVATCEKRRFILSDDGILIRANQGHSVQVNLGL
ncbi:RNA 2'-phosphotransferase [Cupriavidus respiraculi]|uniref:RNA 2'-phosphotransferase n=2 Tax=Cupriavidus respiraculi TaxID=195930 RepID=UPI0039EF3C6B